jgi:ribosomal protein S18 acetylase RimI-like enzyme
MTSNDAADLSPSGVAASAPTVRPATAADRERVIVLWRDCGLVVPHNPPDADFERALGQPGSDILVMCDGDDIIGTVMVGHDGHRGWVYYLAVDPTRQRQRLGAALVGAAEQWLRDRHIRKIQLMVRETNLGVLAFYERIGYEQSPVVVMQRWLDRQERETRK